MVVKILSAAGGFNGIEYNEKKTKDGRSELLDAKNFGILDIKEDATKEDYKVYMQQVAETNPRVKNKQFHAVISCKGKEFSPDQLKDIASLFLEKMGYSKNPYLIYYHSDTDNNHVHVVSTRVDKDGKKVNDAYEKVRSQNAIREIMEILEIKPKLNFQGDLDKALNFKFSTEAQFRLIIEGMGYVVKEEGDKYNFLKSGSVEGELNKDEVKSKIKNGEFDEKRISQVKALFTKYKGVYSGELVWKGKELAGGLESKKEGKFSSPLSDFLSKRLGIELFFHSKDGKTPYGYTIIDHQARQVYKGSTIMELSNLVAVGTNENKKQGIEASILHAIENNVGFTQLKDNFKSNGLYISWKGGVRVKGTNEVFFTLATSDLKILKYQDRLNEASKYELSTAKEKYILASQYFVKPIDLTISEKNSSKIAHVKEQLKGIIQNSGDLAASLKEARLGLIVSGVDTFVINKDHSILINVANVLSPTEINQLNEELPLLEVIKVEEGKDLNRAAEEYEAPEPLRANDNGESFENIQTVTLSDIKQIFDSIKDEKDPAVKKKKKKTR